MELYEHVLKNNPPIGERIYNNSPPPPPKRIMVPLPPQPQQSSLFDILGKPLVDRYEYPTNDSHLWLELFVIVSRTDFNLATILQFIRNTGALLIPDDKYGYRIQPIIGPAGWESPEQYNQERDRYLLPNMQAVIESLLELRYKSDNGLVIT